MRYKEKLMPSNLITIKKIREKLKNVTYSWFKYLAILSVLVIPLIYLFVYIVTTPVSTQIQADITVDQISFRVDEPVELKKSIKFYSVEFSEFENIEFTPSKLPLQNKEVLKTVNITGINKQLWPNVTIDTVNPNIANFGELYLKIAKGTEITFSSDDEIVNIRIKNLHDVLPNNFVPFASLQHNGTFRITTEHCNIDGMKLPSSFLIDSLLEDDTTSLDVIGQSDTLQLTLSLADKQNIEILLGSLSGNRLQLTDKGYIVPNGIPITELSLLRKDMVDGQPIVTSAVKKGEISYPAYPNIEPITFGASIFMFFYQPHDYKIEKNFVKSNSNNFKIDQIVFDPSSNNFKINLSGLAKESVRTYPQNFRKNIREYRLTRSDKFVQASKFNQLLFNIFLWAIPIIIGVVSIITITKIKLSDEDIVKLTNKLSDEDINKLVNKLFESLNCKK